MGLKTPLYENHLQEGAKIVDFAGWDMPIQYKSLMDEHHAVRTDAGVFDVSHMLTVDIKGARAFDFMRYLLANDIAKINPGKAIYSCMLNQDAGIIDDLIAYYFTDDFIRLVINAGNRESDVIWIKEHAQRFNVEIIARDELAIIAIQGPNAREKVHQALTGNFAEAAKMLKPFSMVKANEWMIARTGYTGEDGYEISLPAAEASAFWQQLQDLGVTPCGLGARDTLRLEAGMNLYGQDMTELTTPIESALSWTVSLTEDRDFVGKSALMTKKLSISQELIGLVLDGKGVLRHGQRIFNDQDENIGVITSGSFSPTLSQSIALARIDKGNTVIKVGIRNKKVPATIVKFPFVRKGKKVYKECESVVPTV